MKFSKRLGIYLLIGLIPFFYRWKWNESSVFISSDPEIKYYQLIHSQNGGKAEECFFPAKDLGFTQSMLPFGYPWAFELKDGRCVFQYPVLFTWLQKILLIGISLKWISFFPILFFFLNFLLLDHIISRIDPEGIRVLLSVVMIQCLTPIFLSSLDYSELTITNFFFLASILSYHLFIEKKQFRFGLLLAVSIVFNFQLRPESTIALILYLSISFLYEKDKVGLLKSFSPYVFLSVLLMAIFSIWNQSVYGHYLGMRGLNTMMDMENGQFSRNLLGEWIADLWGNQFKIGIFRGYPILFLGFICFGLKKDKRMFAFLTAGLVFLLMLPIISPYRAGVDIFGMRYFESGIYLLMIGVFLTFGNQNSKLKYYLLVLPFLYFCYKSDSRAIKQWTSSAKLYHQVMNTFDELSPDLIVHRGLSLSYLVGISYVKYPQIAIYSNEDWLKVETILRDQKKKILYLEWEGNQLVNNEFPEKIWKQKFDINFKLNPNAYVIQSEHKIAHFKGYLLERPK
ncbi:hypothetical protein ND861_10855 [Leptospira sp. 2 VSF19]|uniref:Glycosyltransferase RgtA/B/C/D-like domain-containing protein n=1 Tax=Leptospira soteropolitanensis TaxID=2950025 RepID=A0AAW5VLD8_9LEPT|nr:hypothetical protein [Leptospira soteropolitanensis]MCW7493199.1 hypothetical protein [Leptospira soteropolitanensis]MCW7500732.1 hypothetical protein [Leptospira soteropolitanensis]MCW7523049.1 hypothetical protein [Leptospira soteropolitanensis]MCW7526844.1 hypothetical protein [Leptospira soteropolitanensis]MCW7530767.1 hypothetical protein [Leptospira soteropolitanensis]